MGSMVIIRLQATGYGLQARSGSGPGPDAGGSLKPAARSPGSFLDPVVTPGQHRLAALAYASEQGGAIAGSEALVPAVVHHDHRRTVAGAEAFDLYERERS